MVNILRVKARWSGFNGAPGYTVLHFRDFGTGEGPGSDGDAAQAAQAAVRTRAFFNGIASELPDDVTINIETDVEMIEDTTGQLQSVFTVADPGPVQGAVAGVYATPVGAIVNWSTGGIRNGRRIRGRSFLVPLSGSRFADGVLTPAAQLAIQTAATALAERSDTPDLGVYARPTTPTAADGRWSVVTAANVPTLAAVLRSRRD